MQISLPARTEPQVWSQDTPSELSLGMSAPIFFLAMATVSYSKNNITHLKDDNGIVVIDYDGKAALL